ncbi:MAG: glycosyltransferase family 4 protein [gamma proteobacterium endosymbiont of Lamellibrachia anaximandri]|nr:glycosyltransferase family 4 protein [gamma proteobacterium endosymbiont of Lamellibrachia anaximandri]MBL3535486.1 glycosyltransferase family 4 protein [gamma proteobacterium endosymbiont of Lamellibrachia anaximandri]
MEKIIGYILRFAMRVYTNKLNRVAERNNTTSREKKDRYDILITGTFYSDQWIISHLRPMSESNRVGRIYMVAATKLPEIDKVIPIYPNARLQKIVGGTIARLITLSKVAKEKRPDVIVGFHLLLNGLLVVLLGKKYDGHSIYLCGGGPLEVIGGGYLTENKLFKQLGRHDAVVERALLNAVSHFGSVVVRGTDAKHFFEERGVKGDDIYIMSGGIDGASYYPGEEEKRTDLIFVGRISNIKRVDILLQIVAKLKPEHPAIKALIVGDGPDREEMEQMAASLGISENIDFVGWQTEVGDWYRQARVFILTSDSEGLSQSMIQAMMTGLPAVVSDVGDLSELVENDRNGFLIQNQDIDAYASAISGLLDDPDKLAAFGTAAKVVADQCEVGEVAKKWNRVFADLDNKLQG